MHPKVCQWVLTPFVVNNANALDPQGLLSLKGGLNIMGIFYFDAKFVSKAKQSAVAKASYVSNEALYSERDEELKQFRNRTVKPESFIIAPSHAPEWVYERERLWNEVEKVEKQYNAQVLREVVVALPIELSSQEQSDLIREFVQENFVSDGMVADVNIHRDQEHNPHAHILLTVRPFKENGEWLESKTKKEYIFNDKGEPVLNDKGKQKTRNVDLTGWNSKDKLILWRKNYSEKINEYYKIKGIDETVSHLSYEEQGKEIKAKQRLTRSEYYVELKAKEKAEKENITYEPVTTFGKINKEIEDYNREIIELQKQIEELENSKRNVIPFDVSKFEDIRNNFKMASGDFEAIQFVKKRQNVSYVDFESTQSTLESMDYWKRSIDKKLRGLERVEEALKTVRDLYKKGNDNIKRYGFTNDNFVERFNDKMNALNESYGSLTSEVTRYKESYKLAKQAHDIQKELIVKEFEFLYPQYKDISTIDSFEIDELMNKYVSVFKDKGEVLNVIPELESYELFTTKEEQKFRSELWDVVTDYRNQSKVYFSLAKKLDLQEKDYLEVVKNSSNDSQESLNEIYDKAITYLTTKREYNFLTKQYEQTRSKMLDSLVNLYGEHQKDVLEKIPDRVKNLLLERFLQERSVNDLRADLEEVKWRIKEKQFDEKWKDDNDFQEESSQSKSVGGILSDLIESAKQNEGKFDDLEAKRKRAKRKAKKLTKEEILELE